MKVCYEVYSFELNLLIIHLRNYEAFFCFMLIFTKEYWNLVSYLTFKNRKYRTRTSNRIVHEAKNTINNRTRTTFIDQPVSPPVLIIPSFTNKLILGRKITNTGYWWRFIVLSPQSCPIRHQLVADMWWPLYGRKELCYNTENLTVDHSVSLSLHVKYLLCSVRKRVANHMAPA